MVMQADPARSVRSRLQVLGLLTLGSASLVCLGTSPARAECLPGAVQCWESGVQSTITFNPLTTWNSTPDNPGNSVESVANGFVTYGDSGFIFGPTFNSSNGGTTPGNQFGYFAGATGLNWLQQQGPPSSNVGYTSNSETGTQIADFATSSFSFTGGANCGVCGLTFQLAPDSSTQGTRTIDDLVSLGPDVTARPVSILSPTLTYIALLGGVPTGQTIALEYDANFLVRNEDITRAGGGGIRFATNTSAEVPAPLPILGASTAFAYSRRIRRRIQVRRATPDVI